MPVTSIIVSDIVIEARSALKNVAEDVTQGHFFAHHWIKVTRSPKVMTRNLIINAYKSSA